MKHSLLPFLLLTVNLMPDTVNGSPAPDRNGFQKAIAPLLAKYCIRCHGPTRARGELTLHNIDSDLISGEQVETWRILREQVQFHDMPPESGKQPTAEERKALLEWIRQELLKAQQAGVVTDEKLLLPQFGNYVDHQALFGKRQQAVIPAGPRIWRLRPAIYNALTPRLAEKVTGLSNALSSMDGSEIKDYSAPYFLDEASTLQLFGNAKKIAEAQLGPQSKDRILKQLGMASDPAKSESVKEAIEVAFRKALGRGPTNGEVERFQGLYRKSAELGNPRIAAKALLTAALMKPEFLFRQELTNGKRDSLGRARLTPSEIAYALSYALGNLPLTEFLSAAEKGKLETAEQVAIAVRERLKDDSILFDRNPRIIQFFREYFHYPYATEVFKDQPEGGEHKASMLVEDLELTIKEVLKKDKEVLARLLTTSRYYVNAGYGRKKEAGKLVKRNAKTRKYQTAFSLPLDWKWGAHLQPVQFPPEERAGILTHPAWLAAWSGNFDNHPVQRGKWIRTHLLGGSVPDVPIGVDARVPEVKDKTFRERLQMATGKPECWRCHRKMDPLGLPFERYDHYGRYQRLDAGQPVVTEGRIDRTGVPELDARKVKGPVELMQILSKSEHVEQVFVRHVLRYFLGRNETLGDARTLQDAHAAYRRSQGSFRELVVSLLSSDSFLMRQIAEPLRKEK